MLPVIILVKTLFDAVSLNRTDLLTIGTYPLDAEANLLGVVNAIPLKSERLATIGTYHVCLANGVSLGLMGLVTIGTYQRFVVEGVSFGLMGFVTIGTYLASPPTEDLIVAVKFSRLTIL